MGFTNESAPTGAYTLTNHLPAFGAITRLSKLESVRVTTSILIRMEYVIQFATTLAIIHNDRRNLPRYPYSHSTNPFMNCANPKDDHNVQWLFWFFPSCARAGVYDHQEDV